MGDAPENAPEHCPGTQSGDAGKASACAGCPNQKICASGEVNKLDPDIPKIKETLSCVDKKILVLSGKGGVGKSTVTANLAYALSLDEETEIGVMDIDLCGPSIPRILGVLDEQVHNSGSGFSPVYARENLCVMSTGFLLESDNDAIILRGPKKNGLIKQFLRDIDWGTLDYLLIDTPPGTSDEHLTIAKVLTEIGINGAIIVTTPQEISLLDVRKEINFCKQVGIPLVGIVENMSTFVCPKCSQSSVIFPKIAGGVRGVAEEMSIPYITSVPLDPLVGKCCDSGESIFDHHSNSTVASAYRSIASALTDFCQNNEEFKKEPEK